MPAGPAPRAVLPRELPWLRQAICARARDFEIAPLLDVLATMGYRPGDIHFRGHASEGPQPTLIQRIEFGDGAGAPGGAGIELGSLAELTADRAAAAIAAPPRVTITVNLGLLSCRSPLPSYFQHLLRDDVIQEPLVELLGIIDRQLLRMRMVCDRPDHLVAPWHEVTADLLRIHGLDSLVGLGWLFRHVFPELASTVERTSEQLRVPSPSARLGSSALGSACLGPVTRIDVHDFLVTLRCEDSLLHPGVPWPHEAERRLRAIVFPALAPVCMNLTIVLELDDDRALARLADGPGPARDSYLGIDPLGRPDAPDLPVRRIVLYHGLLPRSSEAGP